MAPPLEIALFGTPSAKRDGKPVPLRLPDQALRLLAYLLLHRERIQSREQVAFTLWPDDEESDARANLRRKLHLIRGALPDAREPWFLATATSVGWNAAAPYRLDIEEFERLSRVDETLAEADELYVADLLAGFEDEWIAYERDRLRTLAMSNLQSLVALHRKRRDYQAAIRFAQRLRTVDPWFEDAVRLIVSLRYEAGDRAGALTEYERFRASLIDEMGVEPMPETVCVYESVLANAAAAPGVEAAPARTVQRTPGLPFVGREHEFPDVLEAWAKAAAGAGTSVLVVGEAGIGKSRLIDEFAAFAQSNGGRVMRGGSTPFELNPYQAFSEAFRTATPLLREASIEPLWLAVLATLVPTLHAAFADLPPIVALEAEPERTRLFEAVDVALAAISSVRPTVLVLEDLHWAGSTTISLFEHLVRHAARHRLLVVASYREDDIARSHPLRAARRRLERERLLQIVALGPLDTDAIETIVAQMVDAEPEQRASIARYLYESSDGNPFFLSELVANDRETGLLDAAARHWDKPETSLDAMVSLSTMLSTRLERLSAPARSVAELAAVIGRSFSAELVREVSGVDERSIRDSLDELIDRRLVRDVDAAGIDFAFSHQLIQQAVYAQMSTEARRLRHRRVGSVMEELYSEQLEDYAAEFASHFDRAGEAEHAADYYRLAAHHALGLYATHEARALATRGRELARETLTRFRCIEILEESARRLGEREAQRAAVHELLALSQEIDDPELRREALRRQISLAHECGERDAELGAINLLEPLVGNAQAPWAAIFSQLKGSYLTAIGSYHEARAVMANALSDVSATHHPRIYVECWCALVRLACFEGQVAHVQAFLSEASTFERDYNASQAVTLLETACDAANTIQDNVALTLCAERLLDCARSVGYLEGEAVAYRFAGISAQERFQIDRARDLLQRAVEMSASTGQRLNQLRALTDLGILDGTIGRFDAAIINFEAADKIARLIGYDFGHVGCLHNISGAAYLSGNFKLALTAARRAFEAAERIEAPSARAHALVSIGVAERELDDIDAAILHLEQGTQLERQLKETVALGEDLCELIVALLKNGEVDRASALVGEALDLVNNPDKRLSRPQYVFWTAAAVRHLEGFEVEAESLIALARSTLDKLVSAIPDAHSREVFRRLPHNRAIDNAFDLGVWPFPSSKER